MYKKCFPPCRAPQAGVIRCACLFFSLPDPLSPVSVSGSPSAAPTPALLHHRSATCVFVWKPGARAPGAAVNAFFFYYLTLFCFIPAGLRGCSIPRPAGPGSASAHPTPGGLRPQGRALPPARPPPPRRGSPPPGTAPR